MGAGEDTYAEAGGRSWGGVRMRVGKGRKGREDGGHGPAQGESTAQGRAQWTGGRATIHHTLRT